MVYLLLDPLYSIVPVRGPLISCIQDDTLHVVCCLSVIILKDKPIFQILQSLRQKARQSRKTHQLHCVVHMLMIFTNHQESPNYHIHVRLEGLRFYRSSHNLDHLFRQFKVCTLKLQVICGGYIENEPKVYVDNVTLVINQNVAVVSILNLQKI